MKKCIVFILVLVCVTALIVSCTDNNGTEGDTTTDGFFVIDTNGNETESESTTGSGNTEETTAAGGSSITPGLGDDGYVWGPLKPIN